MQTDINFGGATSGRKNDFAKVVEFVVEAEKLGIDCAWSAEAWGQDAIAPLAFVAARTERLLLGTGIVQISARAPVMTAMTAMTMAAISGGRFILGLGVSGPQVVEGLQGIPFAEPLTRLRETVEIIRIAIAGEKVRYEGRFHQLPRPGGKGKALRLAQPANPDIPIALATLGPRSLELTGEIGDGWVGSCFSPETADAYWEPIRRGAAKAGRSLDGFLFRAGGVIGISDDVEGLIERCRPGLAFTLAAMGSPKTNFYNEAYRRIGFEDAAVRVQRLWLDGRRDDAVAAVPDEMVLATNLLGTEAMVRERIRTYRDAGVTMLSLVPMGRGMTEKLDALGRAVELVAQETAST